LICRSSAIKFIQGLSFSSSAVMDDRILTLAIKDDRGSSRASIVIAL
jgi:hypothetical protein